MEVVGDVAPSAVSYRRSGGGTWKSFAVMMITNHKTSKLFFSKSCMLHNNANGDDR